MAERIHYVNISTIHTNIPIKEMALSIVMNFLQARENSTLMGNRDGVVFSESAYLWI